VSPLIKFDLVENHGLGGDQPDCETNHQRPEWEWLTGADGRGNRAARQIPSSHTVIIHWAIYLPYLLSWVYHVGY
jgi:hypothetical protein